MYLEVSSIQGQITQSQITQGQITQGQIQALALL